jgi:hypothetical protein
MCPHCKKDTKIVPRDYLDGRHDWMCQSCGHAVKNYQPPTDIVLYDRMVLAINECHQTDEVKNIRDQALALEYYARQAQDIESERKAVEIRMRAERRAGELLKEIERGKTGPRVILEPAEQLSEYAKAKKDGKISDDQAYRWQKLADIPEDEFEERLRDPDVIPSTSGMLKKPPSFPKPVIDIPPPTKLDNNPRRCAASCCPDGSEIAGPWNVHDAQSILDEKGFRYGHFGKDHKAVLDFGVECEQLHLLAQFHGLQRNTMVPERLHGYRGVGQGRR